MYKFLCTNITKSRNFTNSYKKLAQNKKYHLDGSKRVALDYERLEETLEENQEQNEEENGAIQEHARPSTTPEPIEQIASKIHNIKSTSSAPSLKIRSYPKFNTGTLIMKESSAAMISKKYYHVHSISPPSTSKRFCSSRVATNRYLLNDKAKEYYKKAMQQLADIQKKKEDREFLSSVITTDKPEYVPPDIWVQKKKKAAKAQIKYPTHTIKHNLSLGQRFKIKEGSSNKKLRIFDEDDLQLKKVRQTKKMQNLMKNIMYPSPMDNIRRKGKINDVSWLPERADRTEQPMSEEPIINVVRGFRKDDNLDENQKQNLDAEFEELIKSHPTIKNASKEVKMKLKTRFVQLLLKPSRNSLQTTKPGEEGEAPLKADDTAMAEGVVEQKDNVEKESEKNEQVKEEENKYIRSHPTNLAVPEVDEKEYIPLKHSKRVWMDSPNNKVFDIDNVCIKDKTTKNGTGMMAKADYEELPKLDYSNLQKEAEKLSTIVELERGKKKINDTSRKLKKGILSSEMTKSKLEELKQERMVLLQELENVSKLKAAEQAKSVNTETKEVKEGRVDDLDQEISELTADFEEQRKKQEAEKLRQIMANRVFKDELVELTETNNALKKELQKEQKTLNDKKKRQPALMVAPHRSKRIRESNAKIVELNKQALNAQKRTTEPILSTETPSELMLSKEATSERADNSETGENVKAGIDKLQVKEKRFASEKLNRVVEMQMLPRDRIANILSKNVKIDTLPAPVVFTAPKKPPTAKKPIIDQATIKVLADLPKVNKNPEIYPGNYMFYRDVLDKVSKADSTYGDIKSDNIFCEELLNTIYKQATDEDEIKEFSENVNATIKDTAKIKEKTEENEEVNKDYSLASENLTKFNLNRPQEDEMSLDSKETAEEDKSKGSEIAALVDQKVVDDVRSQDAESIKLKISNTGEGDFSQMKNYTVKTNEKQELLSLLEKPQKKPNILLDILDNVTEQVNKDVSFTFNIVGNIKKKATRPKDYVLDQPDQTAVTVEHQEEQKANDSKDLQDQLTDKGPHDQIAVISETLQNLKTLRGKDLQDQMVVSGQNLEDKKVIVGEPLPDKKDVSGEEVQNQIVIDEKDKMQMEETLAEKSLAENSNESNESSDLPAATNLKEDKDFGSQMVSIVEKKMLKNVEVQEAIDVTTSYEKDAEQLREMESLIQDHPQNSKVNRSLSPVKATLAKTNRVEKTINEINETGNNGIHRKGLSTVATDTQKALEDFTASEQQRIVTALKNILEHIENGTQKDEHVCSLTVAPENEDVPKEKKSGKNENSETLKANRSPLKNLDHLKYLNLYKTSKEAHLNLYNTPKDAQAVKTVPETKKNPDENAQKVEQVVSGDEAAKENKKKQNEDVRNVQLTLSDIKTKLPETKKEHDEEVKKVQQVWSGDKTAKESKKKHAEDVRKIQQALSGVKTKLSETKKHAEDVRKVQQVVSVVKTKSEIKRKHSGVGRRVQEDVRKVQQVVSGNKTATKTEKEFKEAAREVQLDNTAGVADIKENNKDVKAKEESSKHESPHQNQIGLRPISKRLKKQLKETKIMPNQDSLDDPSITDKMNEIAHKTTRKAEIKKYKRKEREYVQEVKRRQFSSPSLVSSVSLPKVRKIGTHREEKIHIANEVKHKIQRLVPETKKRKVASRSTKQISKDPYVVLEETNKFEALNEVAKSFSKKNKKSTQEGNIKKIKNTKSSTGGEREVHVPIKGVMNKLQEESNINENTGIVNKIPPKEDLSVFSEHVVSFISSSYKEKIAADLKKENEKKFKEKEAAIEENPNYETQIDECKESLPRKDEITTMAPQISECNEETFGVTGLKKKEQMHSINVDQGYLSITSSGNFHLNINQPMGEIYDSETQVVRISSNKKAFRETSVADGQPDESPTLNTTEINDNQSVLNENFVFEENVLTRDDAVDACYTNMCNDIPLLQNRDITQTCPRLDIRNQLSKSMLPINKMLVKSRVVSSAEIPSTINNVNLAMQLGEYKFGNKARLPPIPKKPPVPDKKDNNTKKEKPKGPRDMILPPKIRGLDHPIPEKPNVSPVKKNQKETEKDTLDALSSIKDALSVETVEMDEQILVLGKKQSKGLPTPKNSKDDRQNDKRLEKALSDFIEQEKLDEISVENNKPKKGSADSKPKSKKEKEPENCNEVKTSKIKLIAYGNKISIEEIGEHSVFSNTGGVGRGQTSTNQQLQSIKKENLSAKSIDTGLKSKSLIFSKKVFNKKANEQPIGDIKSVSKELNQKIHNQPMPEKPKSNIIEPTPQRQIKVSTKADEVKTKNETAVPSLKKSTMGPGLAVKPSTQRPLSCPPVQAQKLTKIEENQTMINKIDVRASSCPPKPAVQDPKTNFKPQTVSNRLNCSPAKVQSQQQISKSEGNKQSMRLKKAVSEKGALVARAQSQRTMSCPHVVPAPQKATKTSKIPTKEKISMKAASGSSKSSYMALQEAKSKYSSWSKSSTSLNDSAIANTQSIKKSLNKVKTNIKKTSSVKDNCQHNPTLCSADKNLKQPNPKFIVKLVFPKPDIGNKLNTVYVSQVETNKTNTRHESWHSTDSQNNKNHSFTPRIDVSEGSEHVLKLGIASDPSSQKASENSDENALFNIQYDGDVVIIKQADELIKENVSQTKHSNEKPLDFMDVNKKDLEIKMGTKHPDASGEKKLFAKIEQVLEKSPVRVEGTQNQFPDNYDFSDDPSYSIVFQENCSIPTGCVARIVTIYDKISSKKIRKNRKVNVHNNPPNNKFDMLLCDCGSKRIQDIKENFLQNGSKRDSKSNPKSGTYISMNNKIKTESNNSMKYRSETMVRNKEINKVANKLLEKSPKRSKSEAEPYKITGKKDGPIELTKVDRNNYARDKMELLLSNVEKFKRKELKSTPKTNPKCEKLMGITTAKVSMTKTPPKSAKQQDHKAKVDKRGNRFTIRVNNDKPDSPNKEEKVIRIDAQFFLENELKNPEESNANKELDSLLQSGTDHDKSLTKISVKGELILEKKSSERLEDKLKKVAQNLRSKSEENLGKLREINISEEDAEVLNNVLDKLLPNTSRARIKPSNSDDTTKKKISKSNTNFFPELNGNTVGDIVEKKPPKVASRMETTDENIDPKKPDEIETEFKTTKSDVVNNISLNISGSKVGKSKDEVNSFKEIPNILEENNKGKENVFDAVSSSEKSKEFKEDVKPEKTETQTTNLAFPKDDKQDGYTYVLNQYANLNKSNEIKQEGNNTNNNLNTLKGTDKNTTNILNVTSSHKAKVFKENVKPKLYETLTTNFTSKNKQQEADTPNQLVNLKQFNEPVKKEVKSEGSKTNIELGQLDSSNMFKDTEKKSANTVSSLYKANEFKENKNPNETERRTINSASSKEVKHEAEGVKREIKTESGKTSVELGKLGSSNMFKGTDKNTANVSNIVSSAYNSNVKSNKNVRSTINSSSPDDRKQEGVTSAINQSVNPRQSNENVRKEIKSEGGKTNIELGKLGNSSVFKGTDRNTINVSNVVSSSYNPNVKSNKNVTLPTNSGSPNDRKQEGITSAINQSANPRQSNENVRKEIKSEGGKTNIELGKLGSSNVFKGTDRNTVNVSNVVSSSYNPNVKSNKNVSLTSNSGFPKDKKHEAVTSAINQTANPRQPNENVKKETKSESGKTNTELGKLGSSNTMKGTDKNTVNVSNVVSSSYNSNPLKADIKPNKNETLTMTPASPKDTEQKADSSAINQSTNLKQSNKNDRKEIKSNSGTTNNEMGKFMGGSFNMFKGNDKNTVNVSNVVSSSYNLNVLKNETMSNNAVSSKDKKEAAETSALNQSTNLKKSNENSKGITSEGGTKNIELGKLGSSNMFKGNDKNTVNVSSVVSSSYNLNKTKNEKLTINASSTNDKKQKPDTSAVNHSEDLKQLNKNARKETESDDNKRINELGKLGINMFKETIKNTANVSSAVSSLFNAKANRKNIKSNENERLTINSGPPKLEKQEANTNPLNQATSLQKAKEDVKHEIKSPDTDILETKLLDDKAKTHKSDLENRIIEQKSPNNYKENNKDDVNNTTLCSKSEDYIKGHTYSEILVNPEKKEIKTPDNTNDFKGIFKNVKDTASTTKNYVGKDTQKDTKSNVTNSNYGKMKVDSLPNTGAAIGDVTKGKSDLTTLNKSKTDQSHCKGDSNVPSNKENVVGEFKQHKLFETGSENFLNVPSVLEKSKTAPVYSGNKNVVGGSLVTKNSNMPTRVIKSAEEETQPGNDKTPENMNLVPNESKLEKNVIKKISNKSNSVVGGTLITTNLNISKEAEKKTQYSNNKTAQITNVVKSETKIKTQAGDNKIAENTNSVNNETKIIPNESKLDDKVVIKPSGKNNNFAGVSLITKNISTNELKGIKKESQVGNNKIVQNTNLVNNETKIIQKQSKLDNKVVNRPFGKDTSFAGGSLVTKNVNISTNELKIVEKKTQHGNNKAAKNRDAINNETKIRNQPSDKNIVGNANFLNNKTKIGLNESKGYNKVAHKLFISDNISTDEPKGAKKDPEQDNTNAETKIRSSASKVDIKFANESFKDRLSERDKNILNKAAMDVTKTADKYPKSKKSSGGYLVSENPNFLGSDNNIPETIKPEELVAKLGIEASKADVNRRNSRNFEGGVLVTKNPAIKANINEFKKLILKEPDKDLKPLNVSKMPKLEDGKPKDKSKESKSGSKDANENINANDNLKEKDTSNILKSFAVGVKKTTEKYSKGDVEKIIRKDTFVVETTKSNDYIPSKNEDKASDWKKIKRMAAKNEADSKLPYSKGSIISEKDSISSKAKPLSERCGTLILNSVNKPQITKNQSGSDLNPVENKTLASNPNNISNNEKKINKSNPNADGVVSSKPTKATSENTLNSKSTLNIPSVAKGPQNTEKKFKGSKSKDTTTSANKSERREHGINETKKEMKTPTVLVEKHSQGSLNVVEKKISEIKPNNDINLNVSKLMNNAEFNESRAREAKAKSKDIQASKSALNILSVLHKPGNAHQKSKTVKSYDSTPNISLGIKNAVNSEFNTLKDLDENRPKGVLNPVENKKLVGNQNVSITERREDVSKVVDSNNMDSKAKADNTQASKSVINLRSVLDMPINIMKKIDAAKSTDNKNVGNNLINEDKVNAHIEQQAANIDIQIKNTANTDEKMESKIDSSIENRGGEKAKYKFVEENSGFKNEEIFGERRELYGKLKSKTWKRTHEISVRPEVKSSTSNTNKPVESVIVKEDAQSKKERAQGSVIENSDEPMSDLKFNQKPAKVVVSEDLNIEVVHKGKDPKGATSNEKQIIKGVLKNKVGTIDSRKIRQHSDNKYFKDPNRMPKKQVTFLVNLERQEQQKRREIIQEKMVKSKKVKFAKIHDIKNQKTPIKELNVSATSILSKTDYLKYLQRERRRKQQQSDKKDSKASSPNNENPKMKTGGSNQENEPTNVYKCSSVTGSSDNLGLKTPDGKINDNTVTNDLKKQHFNTLLLLLTNQGQLMSKAEYLHLKSELEDLKKTFTKEKDNDTDLNSKISLSGLQVQEVSSGNKNTEIINPEILNESDFRLEEKKVPGDNIHHKINKMTEMLFDELTHSKSQEKLLEKNLDDDVKVKNILDSVQKRKLSVEISDGKPVKSDDTSIKNKLDKDVKNEADGKKQMKISKSVMNMKISDTKDKAELLDPVNAVPVKHGSIVNVKKENLDDIRTVTESLADPFSLAESNVTLQKGHKIEIKGPKETLPNRASLSLQASPNNDSGVYIKCTHRRDYIWPEETPNNNNKAKMDGETGTENLSEKDVIKQIRSSVTDILGYNLDEKIENLKEHEPSTITSGNQKFGTVKNTEPKENALNTARYQKSDVMKIEEEELSPNMINVKETKALKKQHNIASNITSSSKNYPNPETPPCQSNPSIPQKTIVGANLQFKINKMTIKLAEQLNSSAETKVCLGNLELDQNVKDIITAAQMDNKPAYFLGKKREKQVVEVVNQADLSLARVSAKMGAAGGTQSTVLVGKVAYRDNVPNLMGAIEEFPKFEPASASHQKGKKTKKDFKISETLQEVIMGTDNRCGVYFKCPHLADYVFSQNRSGPSGRKGPSKKIKTEDNGKINGINPKRKEKKVAPSSKKPRPNLAVSYKAKKRCRHILPQKHPKEILSEENYVSTLHKPVGEKIKVVPKELLELDEARERENQEYADRLDKYKNLRITYVTVKRPKRRGAKFSPKIPKRFEESEISEEEKNALINFRFELIKRLNEEFKQLESQTESIPTKSKPPARVPYTFETPPARRSDTLQDRQGSDTLQTGIESDKPVAKILETVIKDSQRKAISRRNSEAKDMNSTKVLFQIRPDLKIDCSVIRTKLSQPPVASEKDRNKVLNSEKGLSRIKKGDGGTKKGGDGGREMGGPKKFSTWANKYVGLINTESKKWPNYISTFSKNYNKCPDDDTPKCSDDTTKSTDDNQETKGGLVTCSDNKGCEDDIAKCSDYIRKCLEAIDDCDKEKCEEKSAEKEWFDITQAVPKAFEFASCQLEENRREDLYYRYNQTSFIEILTYLHQFRAARADDKPKNADQSKTKQDTDKCK